MPVPDSVCVETPSGEVGQAARVAQAAKEGDTPTPSPPTRLPAARNGQMVVSGTARPRFAGQLRYPEYLAYMSCHAGETTYRGSDAGHSVESLASLGALVQRLSEQGQLDLLRQLVADGDTHTGGDTDADGGNTRDMGVQLQGAHAHNQQAGQRPRPPPTDAELEESAKVAELRNAERHRQAHLQISRGI